MNKKILVHALGATMGGAARHLSNLLKEIPHVDPSFDYHFLMRESFPLDRSTGVPIERIPDAVAGGPVRRVAFDNFTLRQRLTREKFDVIVSLTNFGPISSPIPHVLFQRNSLYFCPLYLARVPLRTRLITLARRRMAVATMLRANLIVTPTDAMAEMIRACCPETQCRKFATLYHGFAHDDPIEPLSERLQGVLTRVAGPKILIPEHPGLHKGFDVAALAIATLKHRGQPGSLVLTMSREDWPGGPAACDALLGSLDVTDRVVFLGRVPQRQMASLYGAAALMFHPSLCESFGFPAVESMGYGLPLVAAGTAVNREICQRAALYYEPLNGSQAADQIGRALDAGVRTELLAAARERMKSFDWSWRRYARQFHALVSQVI